MTRRFSKISGLAALAMAMTLLPGLGIPASGGTRASELGTFWVLMEAKADLTPAYDIEDWAERGQFVYDRLTSVADASQAPLRAHLETLGVHYEPFWISNAIRITADVDLQQELAALPGVAAVIEEIETPAPNPVIGKGSGDHPMTGVESEENSDSEQPVQWNIEMIRAPQVWSAFGTKGEGMVVANMDSGVQFDHPALTSRYRGRQVDGSLVHEHNFFDAFGQCESPAPCDLGWSGNETGHGTHVMGTMVGGENGSGEALGVAPGARWLAARGFSPLLSLEWFVAPTDQQGGDPRPDLRPHALNVSLGGGPGIPSMAHRDAVIALSAAGVFAAFSAGNDGTSGCGTIGTPAQYPEAYAVGSIESDGWHSPFSSKGPSYWGEIKPDISAPGFNVVSAFPIDGYADKHGTSMATPHVAGAVALLWSANPALIGDVDRTRELLDASAADPPRNLHGTDDLRCGGTEEDNNLYGEGILDVYSAIELSMPGPLGTLAGSVSAGDGGASSGGTEIRVSGPLDRSITVDASGRFSSLLPVGTYRVTASEFGYLDATAQVQVTEAQTTTQDFTLTPSPRYQLSGTIRDGAGDPLFGVEVRLADTTVPAVTTEAGGVYRFPEIPEGTYQVETGGGCYGEQSHEVALVQRGQGVVPDARPRRDLEPTLDLTLEQLAEPGGYRCTHVPYDFIEGEKILDFIDPLAPVALPHVPHGIEPVELPFTFPFYGQAYDSVGVAKFGYLDFSASGFSKGAADNYAIPHQWSPNAAVYPFWDRLTLESHHVNGVDMDETLEPLGGAWPLASDFVPNSLGLRPSSVRTASYGEAPDRMFVVEWRNLSIEPHERETGSGSVTFEVILHEDGRILFQYDDIDLTDDGREQGGGATIGLENPDGTSAFQYSVHEQTLRDELAILLEPAG